MSDERSHKPGALDFESLCIDLYDLFEGELGQVMRALGFDLDDALD
jgi:hypothetical protein